MRDVRDYRIHSSRDKAVITGGSAFNIKAKSLRLGDFSRKEIELLYRQHTEETGQGFFADALGLNPCPVKAEAHFTGAQSAIQNRYDRICHNDVL